MEAFKPNQGPLDATSEDDQQTAAIGNGAQPALGAAQAPVEAPQNPAPQQATISSSAPTAAAPVTASSGQASATPPVKPKPKSVAAKPLAPQPPANQESPNLLQKFFKGSGGLY
jgi:pilus assembly protein CpaC